jgi:hypothetical protein
MASYSGADTSGFMCAVVLHAVVFDMHYNELLLKNDEIERLKTVIEGLGGGS